MLTSQQQRLILNLLMRAISNKSVARALLFFFALGLWCAAYAAGASAGSQLLDSSRESACVLDLSALGPSECDGSSPGCSFHFGPGSAEASLTSGADRVLKELKAHAGYSVLWETKGTAYSISPSFDSTLSASWTRKVPARLLHSVLTL